MNILKQIGEIIYLSYVKIDFVERLKSGSLKFDFPSESIMRKMDKKENLRILRELGYGFKVSSPGQYYAYEEEISNIKLVLFCQISGGIITEYIHVYVDGEKIEYPYYQSNFSFIYRYLVNDMNAEITAFAFRDYDDFKSAMNDVIGIYEDFKNEFLITMDEYGYLK